MPNPRITRSALAIPYNLCHEKVTGMLGIKRRADPLVARGEIFEDEQGSSGGCTVKANLEELEADIGGSHAMHSI